MIHAPEVPAGALSPRGTLGLDIDGTITALPMYFARLSHTWRAAGCAVHIISSRSDRTEVHASCVQELHEYGIAFDGIYLLPNLATAASACPHVNLSPYQKYLWQKVAIARSLGVTVYFDDDANVVDIFRRFAPDVCVYRIDVRAHYARSRISSC